MRYLNKIIFINSAHIPYAEVKLDGNVHFIGNQGAGKSTLLRAILFFYNMDKSKLGIKTQFGQKSFDEFYLPTPDSFIIYEVCRETGNFFVMAFLSRGRLAFRIVDCPYQQHFFLEEDHNVRYEWGKISEQIGANVFKSNIIRSYQEFSDILYGNSQNVAKDLRRFSIMESTRYRQVQLTIQNIFLNQSLESRVIKDTIIDSMDFAGDSINLNRYREEVKDFRQQYEDIWKWYKVEKNGHVKVKDDADAVVEKFTLHEYTRQMTKELCGHLKYALHRDTDRLPALSDQESNCGKDLARQQRLLSEEEDKYNSERDLLNKAEGGLKAFLDKVAQKRRHYEEIDIHQIEERVSKEGELKIQQQSLKRQEEMLTEKNKDVKLKYDALLDENNNQLKAHQNNANGRILEIKKQRVNETMSLQDETSQKKDAIKERYQVLLDENQTQLDDENQNKHRLQLEVRDIQHANPYQEEMDQHRRQIREFQERQQQLLRDTAKMQQEIDSITSEIALKRKDLESACATDIAAIDQEIIQLNESIQKYENLLSRQKGSMIEWLGEHFNDWENTFGKVFDEDAVLYNTSLNPRQIDSSDTIFGVKVDIENIEKSIRTPEDISRLKDLLEHQRQNAEEQKKQRQQMLQTDIDALESKPAIRLKQLRQNKMTSDVECNDIPRRIELVKKEIGDVENRLDTWRNNELEKLRQQLGETLKAIENIRLQRRALSERRDKELETANKAHEKRKREIDSECDMSIKLVESELSQKQKDCARQEGQLLAQMDAELKGLGVDVDQLEAIRRQLNTVNEELRYIDDHRSEYISWQNDTREYFNLELQKKDERKQIRQRLDDLEEKFEKRRQNYQQKIKDLSSLLNSLKEEQRALSEAIKRVKDFMSNSSCPEEITIADEKECLGSLSDILDNLRNNVAERQQRMEEFKNAVNHFKKNFTPQNTFHFRTEFNFDADYSEFAIELNDFIQNKKIEQYRTRTSQQYAAIIKRIAHDVSDLNQHKSDIEKTIIEINRDFRENNFAGVIKEIELRAVESNDRLMQQLLNIKRFDDEHGFNIGQLNLFTNEINLDRTNEKAVELLMTLVDMMETEYRREQITLSDTFKLEFKVKENDNDTNWVEKLSNVGSDGTDVLVKAMVNIMLINVFKQKISRKFGDFKLHCMMDEIGKLHPVNIEGILTFANVRNIYLINSSPTAYNANPYRYTYMLTKDEKSNTSINRILTVL